MPVSSDVHFSHRMGHGRQPSVGLATTMLVWATHDVQLAELLQVRQFSGHWVRVITIKQRVTMMVAREFLIIES